MPSTEFNHLIDMEFAKDGSLYTLEYGTNWFAQNEEARLSHITFNPGNRPPVAVASVSKAVGAAPLKVDFSSKGTLDYDGDALKYEWTFGKGLPKSTQANPTYTYAKPGEYVATLKVTDAAGNSRSSNVTVKVGNEVPNVEIALKGNKSFYWDKKPVEYEVKVSDKEDGSLAKGTIADADVTMTINYLEGFDKTLLAQGHQANTGFATGKRLIDLSDCKACHSIDTRSIGPSYREVAKRYEKDNSAVKKLSDKVIKGGGGVWGEQAMAAHPQLKQDDAENMVKYILSLAKEKEVKKEPLRGSYVTQAKEKDGSYILTATYTDKGSGPIGPMTGTNTLALRPAKVKANTLDSGKEFMKYKLPTNAEVVVALADGGYIQFDDIDLTGISNLKASVFTTQDMTAGGTLEARLDSPTGPVVGSVEIPNGTTGEVTLPIKSPADNRKHNLVFVFKNPNAKGKPLFALDTFLFNNGAM